MTVWLSVILVFLGGGLGSVCRYGVSLLFSGSLFPKGTFIANIISCLLLGLFIGHFSKEVFGSQAKLLLMTGFCGGFSTFSTYSAEIVSLYRSGEELVAAGYCIVSIILGLLSIFIGLYLSQLLIR